MQIGKAIVPFLPTPKKQQINFTKTLEDKQLGTFNKNEKI